ncbi:MULTISPECIES: hypothetical protein [unclassified Pedobacter]|uniref:hypothetical protein n=1 Tax=unclassified Pedobacter TaxID=2628915 RepID=UPI00141D750A|nr:MULTISPECIES: hypothetical protein [unclassified Pedobacter]NII81354.1 hypothetical protein [Pedobacter sp. SG908]NMN35360.1 hypothetical protein [Pedobacter sp. SG918]
MNYYNLKQIRKPIPKLVVTDTDGQELFSFIFTEENEEILTADIAGSAYCLAKNPLSERTSYELKKDDFLFCEILGGSIPMLTIKSIISDDNNNDISVELNISAHISFWTKQPSLTLFYNEARLFKIKHTFFSGWELESAVAEDHKNFNNFLFTFVSLFVISQRELHFRVLGEY